jgi:hypothetical protein
MAVSRQLMLIARLARGDRAPAWSATLPERPGTRSCRLAILATNARLRRAALHLGLTVVPTRVHPIASPFTPSVAARIAAGRDPVASTPANLTAYSLADQSTGFAVPRPISAQARGALRSADSGIGAQFE